MIHFEHLIILCLAKLDVSKRKTPFENLAHCVYVCARACVCVYVGDLCVYFCKHMCVCARVCVCFCGCGVQLWLIALLFWGLEQN